MEKTIIGHEKVAVQTSRASNSRGSLSGLGDVTELFRPRTLAGDRASETTGFVVTVDISLINAAPVSEVQE